MRKALLSPLSRTRDFLRTLPLGRALLPALATALLIVPVADVQAKEKRKSSSAPAAAQADGQQAKYSVVTDPEKLNKLVQANAFVLMDAKTGKVILERNPDAQFPPASTTKLMTALLAYEKFGFNGSITVADIDTHVEPSSVPLRAGETVQMKDAFYSVMLGSDNDTAACMGRNTGGTVENFLVMMNTRARQLGCTNTSFHNMNGLPCAGHLTTASDLMKIFRKFLSYPDLRTVSSTQSYFLKTQAKAEWIKNHNRLLGVYPGMGPGKTGWTVSSQHTYAASVTRNGQELLLTILKSPNKWVDARLLFDYGFAVTSGGSIPDTVIAQAPPKVMKAVAANVVMPSNEQGVGDAPDKPIVMRGAKPKAGTRPTIITTEYVVQGGDTLRSISSKFNVKQADVLSINEIPDVTKLQVGQTLLIPMPPGGGSAAK